MNVARAFGVVVAVLLTWAIAAFCTVLASVALSFTVSNVFGFEGDKNYLALFFWGLLLSPALQYATRLVIRVEREW